MLLVAFLAIAPAVANDDLSRLDLLPMLTPGVVAGAVTSYDRTGGNDDGFSGKYSFVRKEGDSLVLADLKGPGCITRIHTPTPTDDLLEFYFDGEAKPRLSLPFKKLYSGDTAPFLRPVVDSVGGGNYSYVPLPYAKSCKVVLRAKSFQFYDLNFKTYPAGTAVDTYDPSSVDTSALERARTMFANPRDRGLTEFNMPAGAKLETVKFNTSLPAGKSVTLFSSKKGGRIGGLRLGPSESFEGKGRDVLLRVTWDDAKSPSILLPVGDFFGAMRGASRRWGRHWLERLAESTIATCRCRSTMRRRSSLFLFARVVRRFRLRAKWWLGTSLGGQVKGGFTRSGIGRIRRRRVSRSPGSIPKARARLWGLRCSHRGSSRGIRSSLRATT